MLFSKTEKPLKTILLSFTSPTLFLETVGQWPLVPTTNDACAPLLLGGYDCDFVDPPPDSLQCPVCLLPFRDPHLLSCCGHKGCASCIEQIKAADHPCPICQQPFTTLLDKQLQRRVLDLHVFCSKKGESCRWEGELRDLERHSRRDCEYVEVECI